MTNYDTTPCPTSELPKYLCHDCKHNLHGKPVSGFELTLGGEVIGPTYSSQSAAPFEERRRVHYAEHNSTCDYPDCEKTRIQIGDPLLPHDEYGWVHARHEL